MTADFKDLRQSEGWSRYIDQLGWRVEESKIQDPRSKIYIRKLPLIGAVVKIQLL